MRRNNGYPPAYGQYEGAGRFWKIFGLGILGIAALAYTGPYLLFYVLPVVGLSLLFGWLWQEVCAQENGMVSYDRLGIAIPLVVLLVGGGLWAMKPEPRRWQLAAQEMSQASTQGDAAAGLRRGRKVNRHQEEASPLLAPTANYREAWNEAASKIHEAWYRHVPFVDRSGPVAYGFDHFVWVVGASLLLGAPGVFWVRRRKWRDWFEVETREKCGKNEQELYAKLLEAQKEHEAAKRTHDEVKAGHEKKIQRLLAEIERLRTRERYLTDGKPKPLEATPEKPNLDFLR